MNVVFSTILIAQILLSAPVCSYKILLIPGKSHIFSFAAIAEGLAERGHNIFAPNFVSRWKMCSPRVSRSQKSDFRKSNGRHLGFRFWAIISASINICAPNLVQYSDGKSAAQGVPVFRIRIFENSRWRSP